MPDWSVVVEDVFVPHKKKRRIHRDTLGRQSMSLVTSLRSPMRSQVAQSRVVVDVYSRPGRISLVLEDGDRSEVAVGDILRFLERLP